MRRVAGRPPKPFLKAEYLLMNAKLELWLMRHATAEEGVGKLDADRRLLDEGLRDSRHQGETLKARGVRFGAIASSPLKRAVQTADAVAKAAGFHGEIVEDDRLGMEASVDEMLSLVRELLAANPALKHLLLVGHNPAMGHLKGRLLKNASDVKFQKAALEAFSIEFEESGELAGAKRIAEIPRP